MSEVLVFNKWSTSGIKIEDPGLIRYIGLDPIIVPKTGARYAGNRFYKSRSSIVERLINRLMVTGHKGKEHFMSSGHNTGKATKAYDTVKKALEIVEQRTKQNPVAVLVKAIEYGAPREEIITIEYGGARYPKAVESAPQRRVDIVLRLMCQGAYQKSFNKAKSIEDALADEILLAFQKSPNSTIIAKKNELERQADSSR